MTSHCQLYPPGGADISLPPIPTRWCWHITANRAPWWCWHLTANHAPRTIVLLYPCYEFRLVIVNDGVWLMMTWQCLCVLYQHCQFDWLQTGWLIGQTTLWHIHNCHMFVVCHLGKLWIKVYTIGQMYNCIVCGHSHQSATDSNLLPNRYVHTSLSKKGINLFWLISCNIFNVSFLFLFNLIYISFYTVL